MTPTTLGLACLGVLLSILAVSIVTLVLLVKNDHMEHF
jgi:hypothetical protein